VVDAGHIVHDVLLPMRTTIVSVDNGTGLAGQSRLAATKIFFSEYPLPTATRVGKIQGWKMTSCVNERTLVEKGRQGGNPGSPLFQGPETALCGGSTRQ
jgi:hypothetical protein